ncbi:MAG: YggS family pyridoxal phosphate-dependent enzyme [Balneolaceae bacterium]
MSEPICKNLETVHQRIQQTCKKNHRNPEDIMLVAVSKTKPVQAITTAYECGQVHFGENRARELQDKMDQIDIEPLQWHFVGPMQTNKIKYMVERVNWIQSIYKKKYLKEIEKRASRIDRVIHTLIQINISKEEQKQGCSPSKLPQILEYAQSLKHVRVSGLMGMATYAADPEDVRDEFKLLKEAYEEHQSFNSGSVNLKHLSMGMTHDFEVAIEEGSTMVRIGTAIFGKRNYDH